MAITIQDNGGSIMLTIGTQVRNIIKPQIVEISVIKTNVIKIDIGKGALYNIYIPYPDVSSPVTTSPEALKDAITAMLPNPSTGSNAPSGMATETKQIQQIDILNVLKNDILNVKVALLSLDGKIVSEPSITDESGISVIYKGYAGAGVAQGDQLWAIQKIERIGDTNVITWANGSKNFSNRWSERDALTFS